jgi:hypothetical protein
MSRCYRILAFTLLMGVGPKDSPAESDFRAGTQSIASKQSALDQALARIGVPLESGRGAVLRSDEDSRKGGLFRVHAQMATLQAPSGKFLFGRLVHKLVVPADGAPAIVELSAGQGSFSGLRIMGTAKHGSSGDRVVIEFGKLLFKGGSSFHLQAVALDESGALGVPAYVMSQRALSVTGALASSFISGVAASQQTLVANPFGFQAAQPTGRNAVLQGLSQTAADQSKRLIEQATAEKPVLILEPMTEVSVLIQDDVRF